MNQLLPLTLSNDLSITTYDMTKDWFSSISDLDSDTSPRVLKRLDELQGLLCQDPLHFFFQQYYVYSYSFSDISQNLARSYNFSASKDTLTRRFQGIFWWKVHTSHDERNTRYAKKHWYRMMWNNGWETHQARSRENVQKYVSKIVSSDSLISIELFDHDVYNNFAYAVQKVSYIFALAWLGDDAINHIILSHKDLVWIQVLSKIINSLCKTLIVMAWIEGIEPPEISKQTVNYRIKNMWK